VELAQDRVLWQTLKLAALDISVLVTTRGVSIIRVIKSRKI